MLIKQSTYDATLLALLVMHEKGETPTRPFINEHAEVFEILWQRGLGCFQIFRMEAGNIRPRRVYSGVLTPRGIEAAKALRS